ncbi:MAG: ABC transporter permease, partial [Chloroflexota bacterium]
MTNTARKPLALILATIGALLFLHVPLGIILLYSFTTDDRTYTFPLPGLTLQWFPTAWARADMWQALWLSVKVAGVATAIALALGSLIALAIYRSKFFGREAISFLVIL